MGMYETGNPPSIKAEEIKNAVISPVGKGERLRDIVSRKQAETAAVIISDATRGVPTERVAPYIIEELTAAGMKGEYCIYCGSWCPQGCNGE